MPAGRDFVVCSISSGEDQFLDQWSLSGKTQARQESKPAKPVRLLPQKTIPKPEAVPRRRAGQGVFSTDFSSLPVARRKKTPSRGVEAWEGVRCLSKG